MSVNKRFTAFVGLFTLTLMAIPAVSQGRRGGSVTPVPVNPPAMITVEGVVSAVDFQYGSGYPSFELTAGSVKYTIFIGPLRFVDDNDFELSVGDRLNAVIFEDPKTSNVYVAAVLTNLATGQTLALRDAAGLPLWVRGDRAGHGGFGGANSQGQGSTIRQGQGLDSLRAGQPSIDISTLRSYAGSVTKVSIGAGETHPAIEVSLNTGGTAIFCLGPYRYLEQIGFEVTPGSAVTIKAANCAQDAGEFVVFEVTVGVKAFQLRDVDGTPLWYFGKGR